MSKIIENAETKKLVQGMFVEPNEGEPATEENADGKQTCSLLSAY